MKRYTVVMQRQIRLRFIREWELGPYRFMWMAKLALWWNVYETVNVSQGGYIVVKL